MLAAICEMAERKDGLINQPHMLTAEYLEACNFIFEKGILSHDMITSCSCTCLTNISEGMKWFFKWKQGLQEEPGIVATLTCTCGVVLLYYINCFIYRHQI